MYSGLGQLQWNSKLGFQLAVWPLSPLSSAVYTSVQYCMQLSWTPAVRPFLCLETPFQGDQVDHIYNPNA